MGVPKEIQEANEKLLKAREESGIVQPTSPPILSEPKAVAALFRPMTRTDQIVLDQNRTERLFRGDGVDCEQCGKAVLPEELPSHLQWHMDSKRRREEEASRKATQDQERRTTVSQAPLDGLVSGISQDHATAQLSDFSERIRRPVEGYLSQDELRGIFIGGPAGTGKTRLLAAISRGFLVEGWKVQFVMARRLFRRIWATYRTNAEESEDDVLGELMACEVLAIDDLGHEGKVSDAVIGALHEVLAVRHDNFRPTVVTTNLSLQQIGEVYDQSIASRLGAWFQVILAGKDRRAK